MIIVNIPLGICRKHLCEKLRRNKLRMGSAVVSGPTLSKNTKNQKANIYMYECAFPHTCNVIGSQFKRIVFLDDSKTDPVGYIFMSLVNV